ncbi:MAG: hypothetical protein PWQ84_1708 [Thermotogaceae bacterium]|jgi:hypothetical protein|nr:hypothetical protein [Thermotogaceae bacterium]
MSDMKEYTDHYSYTGKYKQREDGSRLLEVSEFVYDGKYYQPAEPLKFIFRNHPEEGGWVSVDCDEIAGTNGGLNIEEALGNALMDAAHLYEHLIFSESPLTKRAAAMQDKLKKWLVILLHIGR